MRRREGTQTCTEERPCEDRGRDWSEAVLNQGMLTARNTRS